jgi:hypothetical protein
MGYQSQKIYKCRVGGPTKLQLHMEYTIRNILVERISFQFDCKIRLVKGRR